MKSNRYQKVYASTLIADEIRVHNIEELLRQDMENQIWITTSSQLSVKPSHEKEWLNEELDLDDDEITVTITTKKGKKIEYTKKLEIYNPSDKELMEWDQTHDKEFVSRMRHPPADEVGGNTGVLR